MLVSTLTTSLPPEPSSIFCYLKLNNRPIERGFLRYMPSPFYPASVVLFQLHGCMDLNDY